MENYEEQNKIGKYSIFGKIIAGLSLFIICFTPSLFMISCQGNSDNENKNSDNASQEEIDDIEIRESIYENARGKRILLGTIDECEIPALSPDEVCEYEYCEYPPCGEWNLEFSLYRSEAMPQPYVTLNANIERRKDGKLTIILPREVANSLNASSQEFVKVRDVDL